jgi:NADPH-dependent 2,4-dienoyl-CoA reductase/sulfur reductase-like enzyme
MTGAEVLARVVVVGAGLGGLRAAEGLRAAGYSGHITIVGDEPLLPYNRPPLSKEALKTGIEADGLYFRRRASVDDVEWRLGTGVDHVNVETPAVVLTDGTVLPFAGLVVATGIRTRRLPIPGPEIGRYGLRTMADAVNLRKHLKPGARLLVIGAGFIGCEVAATARLLGVEVDVVALDAEPMIRPLGPDVGAALRKRHEQHGVRFHLGHTVDHFEGDGRVESAVLDDGTVLKADVVLEAVGSVPNTESLANTGADLTDGVLADDNLRVVGVPFAAVAVGDVARYPNLRFDDVPRRIEHWNLPTETGRRAGATLAALMAGSDLPSEVFAPLPAFWSDQYDHQLQSYGQPDLGDEVVVVEGDLSGPSIVEYRRAGDVVGVLGIDRTAALMPWRKALLERPVQRVSPRP